MLTKNPSELSARKSSSLRTNNRTRRATTQQQSDNNFNCHRQLATTQQTVTPNKCSYDKNKQTKNDMRPIIRTSMTVILLQFVTVESFSMSMSNVKTFHFGAGCFWAPADKIKTKPGIINASVGYCGDDGVKDVPSYERVCQGRTKLVEAVRVEYDADQLTFPDLLAMFNEVNTAQWGTKRQYEGIIFTSSDEEKSFAEDFLQENKQVVAKVEPMSDTFYTAERYHQDYWAKWRTRIPLLVVSLALVGKFGGDMSQTIYNTVCYGFIGFTLLERKFDTSVDKIVVGKD